jgi:putative two-component system response regulator
MMDPRGTQAKANGMIDFETTVLVADPAPDTLDLLETLLNRRYRVLLARSGAETLQRLRQGPQPDLLLLADGLPDMPTPAVLAEIRAHPLTAALPVLFLGSEAAHSAAYAAGATDALSKPLLPAAVLARVGTLARLAVAERRLRDRHADFDQLLAERTRGAEQLQDATIIAMASLAESRDPDTGYHIRRTQRYVLTLARELRYNARYTAELDDERIALLFKAAPLHDIGMVGVPDSILLNRGTLSEDEVAIMRHHTVYGRDAIDGVARSLGGSNDFLRFAREICWSHHEHWDGSGYPEGLAGSAIALSARLMAVADVYDALVTERSYRPAFTHETAVELIRQGRGEHFDPDVVDAMLVAEGEFMAIAARFRRPEAGRCEVAA